MEYILVVIFCLLHCHLDTSTNSTGIEVCPLNSVQILAQHLVNQILGGCFGAVMWGESLTWEAQCRNEPVVLGSDTS